MSIQLHPKYGLNPTMPVCFICGQEKGEIALLGAAYKEEAPHRMLIDEEPCNECKKLMEQGIIFSERNSGGGPTGTLVAIKDSADFISGIDASLRKDILKRRVAFVTTKDWDAIGFPRKSFDNRS